MGHIFHFLYLYKEELTHRAARELKSPPPNLSSRELVGSRVHIPEAKGPKVYVGEANPTSDSLAYAADWAWLVVSRKIIVRAILAATVDALP